MNCKILNPALICCTVAVVLFVSPVKPELGKPCSTTSPCSPTNNFEICNPQTSVCECEAAMIAPDNVKCVVKPGATCIRNPTCVAQATCYPDTKICACNAGFDAYDDHCLGTYNTPCSRTIPCNSNVRVGLTCNEANWVCKCVEEGLDHEWSASRKRCLKYADIRCGIDGDDSCTVGAKCVGGICKCDEAQYTPTATKTCKLNHGSACLPEVTPGLPESQKCNPRDFLTCRTTVCDCNEALGVNYEPSSDKCKVVLNGKCDVADPPTGSPTGKRECATGTTCKKSGENSDNVCVADSDNGEKGKAASLGLSLMGFLLMKLSLVVVS